VTRVTETVSLGSQGYEKNSCTRVTSSIGQRRRGFLWPASARSTVRVAVVQILSRQRLRPSESSLSRGCQSPGCFRRPLRSERSTLRVLHHDFKVWQRLVPPTWRSTQPC